MSVNWVMLSETEGFTPLPGEQRLYQSPPRTALSLQTLNKFPGKQPYTLSSTGGCVHLTNRRIVYLPTTPSASLQSFAAPILNLHDTHVTAPFFGPNVWSAIVQPVPGGNIPPEHAALELKMTFKDGGAFDFHSTFERIKERLQQAVEVARESGHLTGDGTETGGGQGAGPLGAVDMNAVHLDELPAYEDATSTRPVPVARQEATLIDLAAPESTTRTTPPEAQFSPPAEPPPGYEDVQSQSISDELERRLRGSASS
ncbi:hypothetical protein EG328_005249 [Venturia inaequalis]|uniref:WW-domain-binding protein n=1 Tax=Venturia inaequalis TaxID=5025 RepID=A0A8H3UK06_VENIN|nr:hypothetical protein EG328_005249 [Venturia inaequalis]